MWLQRTIRTQSLSQLYYYVQVKIFRSLQKSSALASLVPQLSLLLSRTCPSFYTHTALPSVEYNKTSWVLTIFLTTGHGITSMRFLVARNFTIDLYCGNGIYNMYKWPAHQAFYIWSTLELIVLMGDSFLTTLLGKNLSWHFDPDTRLC